MSKLTILRYPDHRLRRKAEPVAEVNDEIRQLADDMLETMYDAPGIGLAATQVNVQKRVLVIDVSDDRSEPRVFINPEILEKRGEEVMEEGCLSVPGIFAEVKRADWVRVKALGRDGESFEMEADGLLAVCIQHEIDHLNGKLFVDYLSELKRRMVRKRLEKERRAIQAGRKEPEKPAQPVI
ncbi:peptide deformylase [Natronospira proteinivora]|uniref:Peptide deformylase n=1 Tax=Natronospira proteinivora TaxID=1807133 RepID=A0ABT1G9S3_9GAMM|nr:peptide deformylase [Natronospira proteinivora]MCP1728074.1 peptide deformylase [Natronospira proteinivora]